MFISIVNISCINMNKMPLYPPGPVVSTTLRDQEGEGDNRDRRTPTQQKVFRRSRNWRIPWVRDRQGRLLQR